MTDGNHDGRPSSLRTAQESVPDRIRHLILSRTLVPGQRLVQSELAEQLGVSRTPIREALHRLESDGLVKLSPHKGASVADLSISDLKDIYSIRIAIEGYGAYLAAQNVKDQDLVELEALLRRMREGFEQSDRWHLLEVNREFYAVLYAIAEQPRLYALIMNHIDLADMYRRMAFAIDHYYGHTIADHEALLTTFREADPQGAERVTRDQLQQTLASLLRFLEQTAAV
ncbi:MAG: GntR family transcriptional regulator [Chloroflexi bacterium]|nr:GntR family transcriptional regulator [Chloroflexota bacterium]